MDVPDVAAASARVIVRNAQRPAAPLPIVSSPCRPSTAIVEAAAAAQPQCGVGAAPQLDAYGAPAQSVVTDAGQPPGASSSQAVSVSLSGHVASPSAQAGADGHAHEPPAHVCCADGQ